MHDDIGAMLGGADEVGRGQRVVDHERNAGFLGAGRAGGCAAVGGPPASLATAATAGMSGMMPPGLAIDSTKIALVFGVTAARKDCGSVGSAQRTVQSHFLNEGVNWLIEPP